MEQTRLWLSSINCHIECSRYQGYIIAVAGRPTDHGTRMKVKQNGKIQVTFTRWDISDIANPGKIRCISEKLST